VGAGVLDLARILGDGGRIEHGARVGSASGVARGRGPIVVSAADRRRSRDDPHESA
jgi:hypothetical protein